MNNTWARYAVLVLTILAGLATYGATQKRKGRREFLERHKEDVRVRTERGTDAFHEERRQTSGLSNRDILERLRSRDRNWGRL